MVIPTDSTTCEGTYRSTNPNSWWSYSCVTCNTGACPPKTTPYGANNYCCYNDELKGGSCSNAKFACCNSADELKTGKCKVATYLKPCSICPTGYVPYADNNYCCKTGSYDATTGKCPIEADACCRGDACGTSATATITRCFNIK